MADTPASNSTFASRRAERLGATDKTVKSGDAQTKGDGGSSDEGDGSSSSGETGADLAADLQARTVPELQALAAEREIDGRSGMTKSELVEALAKTEER